MSSNRYFLLKAAGYLFIRRMHRNALLIIIIISLTKANFGTTEEQCSTAEYSSCREADGFDAKQGEKYSIISRRLKKSLASYEPCSNDANDVNCTCHVSVLERDLAPYKSTGFNRKMIMDAAKFGTRYKVYEKQLYRDANCMFPARCQGIEYFLLQLLSELPNMDMVINTRDYPQLHSSWTREGPVFSFSKTKEYNDIMYPAWTFWAGGPATKLHPTGIGRWDLMREKLKNRASSIPWHEKQEIGFFRGSRTSDERDSLILLSRRKPELVEAQYTKNQAWKSLKDTLDAPPAAEVSFEDHCKYKYLFNFRGVAASFRLKHLFLCKSLVFHVGDEWQEFFYDQLKPWVHYVPLESYPSQEQFEEVLNYFKKNDARAQEIAQRGYDFIWEHLRMQDVKCYWRKLLERYVKLMTYEVQPDPEMIHIGGSKDEL